MTDNRTILVVDGDLRQRTELGRILDTWGYAPTLATDGIEAGELMAAKTFAMVIAEYEAAAASARELLALAKGGAQDVPVLFLSREPSIEAAVQMMKYGALDFVVKPIQEAQLRLLVRQAFGETEGGGDGRRARCRGRARIVAEDAAMARVLELARQIADSRASVFIQGESGTGKEVIARFIHDNSCRSQGPFVAINCAALPENLLESELFGHEKGAFTGAVSAKPGKFELADGGTLLLDEVTEMPFHLQAKLLRVLQEREVDRLGARRPVPVDIRVLSTTNRDMGEAIETKAFREDLYYRLNVIPLTLPPLRERPKDLPVLARHFIDKYNDLDGRCVKSLADAAVEKLMTLPFRGNVRELENMIERAVLLCDGDCIRPADLFPGDVLDAEVGETGVSTLASFPAGAPMPLKEVEKNLIFQALDQTSGNRTHAAKLLGISVRTLRNKLNEYKEAVPEDGDGI